MTNETLMRDLVLGILLTGVIVVVMLAVLVDTSSLYGVTIEENESTLMYDLTSNLTGGLVTGESFSGNVSEKEGFSATTVLGVDVTFWSTLKLLFGMMFTIMGSFALAGQAIGIPAFVTYGLQIIGGVLLAFLAVSALLRKDT